MPLAISLGDLHQLRLGAVPLLALDVAVCGLRQHRCVSGQLSKSPIDGGVITSNHEEADALAYLAAKAVLMVEPQRHCRLRGIVPHQAVPFICNHKRNTYALPGRRVVVVLAVDDVTSPVEKAFLVLSQAVVVLIISRAKACADREERQVARTPIVLDIVVAVFVVRDRHLPPVHLQQGLSVRRLDAQTDARR